MKNTKKSTGYFLVTIFCLAILTFCSLKTQAQTIVSTTPENKNAILEEFTGIYCVYCPDGHLIANNLKDMKDYCLKETNFISEQYLGKISKHQ